MSTQSISLQPSGSWIADLAPVYGSDVIPVVHTYCQQLLLQIYLLEDETIEQFLLKGIIFLISRKAEMISFK